MELFKLLGTIAIDGTDKANKDIDSVTGQAEKSGSKLGEAAKKIGGFAVKASAAAVTAVGGAGVAAAKLASDYETAFAQVNTLLTGNEADIEKYKNDIIAASNETGKSTTEMSAAIYNAISAGVEQGKAIEFTTEAMKLAKGGFTDATTAVDILTTAINAYGLESSDATDIANKLITTQNLGKTTVDELASSMGKVIPTAKSLGVDIDDLCGMYATMTSNGIATAETTTYMNSMLNELGKQGTTAAVAFAAGTEHIKEGGLTMAEAMESGWELTDVLSILDEQAAASGTSINNMFSSAEAGKAANVLWDNAQKLNESVEAMGNSAGATEEAYKKMDETLSSKMEKLKTNFTNVGIQLGEKLIPYVMKFSELLMNSMPTIQSLIDNIAPTVEGLFENILPLIAELAEELFPIIFDLIEQLIPPITQIVKAILPVVVDLIKTLLPPLVQIVKAILPALMPILKLLLSLIKPLIPLLQPILDLLTTLLNTIIPPLTSVIKVLASVISGVLTNAFKSISPIINNVKGYFEGLIKFVSGVFTGNWKKAWEGVTQIFKNLFEGLVGMAKAPLNTIIEGINAVFEKIGTITIPKWVPSIGGETFSLPQLPKLAKGGVLEKGQVGLLEGNGAEAVVPLEKNTEWIRKVSQELNINTLGSEKIDRLEEAVQSILDYMSQYMPQMANMQLVMDTGATVGALAPAMDRELGKRAARAGRGV